MARLHSCWPALDIERCAHAQVGCPMSFRGEGDRGVGASGRCMREDSRDVIVRRLSRCVVNADDMHVLRRLDSGGAQVCQESDAAVIRRIAAQVDMGALCLVERAAAVAVRLPDGTGAGAGALAPGETGSSAPAPASARAPAPAPLRPPTPALAGQRMLARASATPPPARPPVASYWIEIELVGEDDKPVGDVEYAVKTPSGKTLIGRLDQRGHARIDQLDTPGVCAVSFPALDQDAWEFVQSLPALNGQGA